MPLYLDDVVVYEKEKVVVDPIIISDPIIEPIIEEDNVLVHFIEPEVITDIIEEDIFETIKLVREIGPESYDLNFVAPYIGTDIHAVSKKLGYISNKTHSLFFPLQQNVINN